MGNLCLLAGFHNWSEVSPKAVMCPPTGLRDGVSSPPTFSSQKDGPQVLEKRHFLGCGTKQAGRRSACTVKGLSKKLSLQVS